MGQVEQLGVLGDVREVKPSAVKNKVSIVVKVLLEIILVVVYHMDAIIERNVFVFIYL